MLFFSFFITDSSTTEFYTLSLHDALPISEFRYHPDPIMSGSIAESMAKCRVCKKARGYIYTAPAYADEDQKSTRLNSSHANISYAVFCLKKKKNIPTNSNSPSSSTPVTSH